MTQTTPEGSPLQNVGDPPNGVAGQFASALGAGPGLCDAAERPSEPGIVASELLYSGGIGPFLCIFGFGPERPVDVVVGLPDGEQRSRSIGDATEYFDEAWVFVWRSEPEDPFGSYQIDAQQGELVASSSFDVIPPDRRGLSIEPTTTRAGEVVDFVLFGYEPLSEVGLHFYRLEGDEYVYLASDTVTADADGWGRYSLVIRPTDSPGNYLVRTTPPTAFGNEAVPPFVFGGFSIAE